MITYLIIAVFVLIIVSIYKVFFNITRTKLENERDKINYLYKKFDHLLESKEEKIINIMVYLPYKDFKPWIVKKTVKTGTFPFNDKENDIEIYSISDKDLTDEMRDDVN